MIKAETYNHPIFEQDPKILEEVDRTKAQIAEFVAVGRQKEKSIPATPLILDVISEYDTRKSERLLGLYNALYGGSRKNALIVDGESKKPLTKYWVGAVVLPSEIKRQKTIVPVYFAEHYEPIADPIRDNNVLSYVRAYWAPPNHELDCLEPDPSVYRENRSTQSLFDRAREFVVTKALQRPIN